LLKMKSFELFFKNRARILTIITIFCFLLILRAYSTFSKSMQPIKKQILAKNIFVRKINIFAISFTFGYSNDQKSQIIRKERRKIFFPEFIGK